MHRLFYILLSCFLVSCTTSEKLIDYSSAPQWVQEHPLSEDYYIGVGVSKKKGVADYRDQAKKNAFNEISSGISVSVSSNSVFQQQENNGKFKEMFDSSTETYTNNELAGCKQVGRWENKSEYWTYYKLSKAKVEEDKRNAIEDATISLRQALNYDQQNDYPKAISNYSLALSAVKPYLGDRLKTEFNGETIFLGQYILDHYRGLISSVNLFYDNNIPLEYESFKPIMSLEVKLNRGDVALANIPLKIESNTFKYEGNYKFDGSGVVNLPAVNANTYRSQEVVILSIDVDQMIEESVSDDLVKEVLKDYKTTYLELLYRLKKQDEVPNTTNTNENINDGNSTTGNNNPTIEKPNSKFNLGKFADGLQKNIDRVNEIKNAVEELGDFKVDNEKSNSSAPNTSGGNSPTKNNSQSIINIAKENTFEDDKIANISSYLKSANKTYYTPEIREVVKQFNFEDNKLEVAKMCYPYTIDKSNYYTLNSLFNFSSTKDELNEFINNQ